MYKRQALRRRGHTVDTFELELGNFEVDENFTGRFIDKLFNGEENTACSNVPEAKEHEGNAVSYTHLDVYKRQGFYCWDRGVRSLCPNNLIKYKYLLNTVGLNSSFPGCVGWRIFFV